MAVAVRILDKDTTEVILWEVGVLPGSNHHIHWQATGSVLEKEHFNQTTNIATVQEDRNGWPTKWAFRV